MTILLLALVASSLAVSPSLQELKQDTTSDNWAIIIAGSRYYYNYRHQADISHMYQILTKTGQFKAENLITMMYNDIAENDSNPVKGNIINHVKGPNVYKGVKIDYTGEDVNAKSFLAAIKGVAKKGKKSFANAKPQDNIFMYFADHGATHLVAMPDASQNYLYAKDWFAAIQYMHKKQMFKRMVIFVEACESGSMFTQYTKQLAAMNVYTQTASNPTESSYACYWDAKRQTYLGDTYSVKTCEYMDDNLHSTCSNTQRNLQQEFKVVRKETNTSHAQQYGDTTRTGDQNICEFLDFDQPRQANATHTTHTTHTNSAFVSSPITDETDSRDVVLQTLLRRQALSFSLPISQHIQKLIDIERMHIASVRASFMAIASQLYSDINIASVASSVFGGARQLDSVNDEADSCLEAAVKTTTQACGTLSDHGLKYVSALWNMCIDFNTNQVVDAVLIGCTNSQGFSISASSLPLPVVEQLNA